jgi:hypothetical protein
MSRAEPSSSRGPGRPRPQQHAGQLGVAGRGRPVQRRAPAASRAGLEPGTLASRENDESARLAAGRSRAGLVLRVLTW